jgi:N-acetylglucosaminyldiphosphoundecaprenol N-acetyl-beta-D-mannosaminyltransferase
MEEVQRIEILGVPVDMVNMDQAIEVFGKLMEKEGCSLIVTPNSEIIVRAEKDNELAEIIRSADLIIPDGIGLVYASKILGHPLGERVTGIDLLNWILDWLEQHDKSIYLLGSTPGEANQPGVAEKAGEKMREAFPNLKIAGTNHGYFKEEDEAGLVKEINNSGADFLCVALGAPKQEKFIVAHQNELKVRAAIGVGGSLDVWAGTQKRAPGFYQRHGLEWLYRFAKQPSRYKRMAALPLFMIKVLKSK